MTYDSSKSFPEPALIDGDFQPFDDMTLVPHDSLERFGEPEQTVELDVIMDNLGDGANYAFFNNISYASPKVPTLYTALTTGDTATNPEVYGTYGHHFQVLYRGEESSGTFEQSNMTESDFPQVPMRRDTLVIWPEGNIVLRFKADNPGTLCQLLVCLQSIHDRSVMLLLP